jgi:predicted DNA-binding antitoxin AbrB/MazE fold protein
MDAGDDTMNETISAIVENGMLRPETPLALAEGTRVQITVSASANGVHGVAPSRATKDAVRKLAEMNMVREIIAEIATMPDEGPNDDAHVARDHDHYLYGAPRQS